MTTELFILATIIVVSVLIGYIYSTRTRVAELQKLLESESAKFEQLSQMVRSSLVEEQGVRDRDRKTREDSFRTLSTRENDLGNALRSMRSDYKSWQQNHDMQLHSMSDTLRTVASRSDNVFDALDRMCFGIEVRALAHANFATPNSRVSQCAMLLREVMQGQSGLSPAQIENLLEIEIDKFWAAHHKELTEVSSTKTHAK